MLCSRHCETMVWPCTGWGMPGLRDRPELPPLSVPKPRPWAVRLLGGPGRGLWLRSPRGLVKGRQPPAVSPCNLVFWLHLGLGCTLCDSPRLGPLAIVVVFLCAAPRQRLLVFLLFDTLVALILYSPQVCTLATPRGSTPSSFGHGALAPPRAPRGYMIAPLGGTVLIEPVCVD